MKHEMQKMKQEEEQVVITNKTWKSSTLRLNSIFQYFIL